MLEVWYISGPQLDWDPDIVAGLDDDFNYEDPANQLDDDFITKAMKEDSEVLNKQDKRFVMLLFTIPVGGSMTHPYWPCRLHFYSSAL